MFNEDPYFEFVQQEAAKIGKYFMLDSGEGRDFEDSKTGWYIEDLSGWLVDPSEYEKFIRLKKDEKYRQDFADYVFAIWEKNIDGSIKIEFKKY